jgi:hypothetical protein
MKTIALLLAACVSLASCAQTTTTFPDGRVVVEKKFDAAGVASGVQSGKDVIDVVGRFTGK